MRKFSIEGAEVVCIPVKKPTVCFLRIPDAIPEKNVSDYVDKVRLYLPATPIPLRQVNDKYETRGEASHSPLVEQFLKALTPDSWTRIPLPSFLSIQTDTRPLKKRPPDPPSPE
jgi:hypothetical protein